MIWNRIGHAETFMNIWNSFNSSPISTIFHNSFPWSLIGDQEVVSNRDGSDFFGQLMPTRRYLALSNTFTPLPDQQKKKLLETPPIPSPILRP